MKHILALLTVLILISCKPKVVREYIMEPCPEKSKKPMAQVKQELLDGGFEIFDYIDEETGDTIIMQQYFMVFLKRGSNRDQDKIETDSLQALHMAHLTRMYNEGYADISGPFGDNGDLRGITIYNVPNLKIADSLAHLDPMVKAGRIELEIKPWWAGKGYPLR